MEYQGFIDADDKSLYSPGLLPRAFSSVNTSDPAECREFLDPSTAHKYIMGINVYVEKLVRQIDGINGLVDEALPPSIAFDSPVVGLDSISSSALVLVVSSGRPPTASRKLESKNIRYLDYFSFLSRDERKFRFN